MEQDRSPPPSAPVARLLPFPFSLQGTLQAGELSPEQAPRAVQEALGRVRSCAFERAASSLAFKVLESGARTANWNLLAGLSGGLCEAAWDFSLSGERTGALWRCRL
jgi:hypothetical protein